MRNLIITSVIATFAALSFAAPSHAGGYYGGGYNDCYDGGGYSQPQRRQSYRTAYYEPTCWIKKIRKYDYYGNLVVKRIRVCD